MICILNISLVHLVATNNDIDIMKFVLKFYFWGHWKL